MMIGIKSYGNSYLYNRIPDYERHVLEFIMKADRIDKTSNAFGPIIEDVKRRQSSSVLSRVLMRDDVVLCINTRPLPSSFKVFACKDVKNDRGIRVFIDCTGLITERNGFYSCSKIDIVCTYLLSAMTNILYHKYNMRVINNPSIIQASTECFVSLATHVLDYLRPNGFAENRNKIAYILGMYYQVSIMGLDRDSNSVRGLAAKTASIQSKDINAMEIYYKDKDIVNIDTIITSIAETFKMKGVDTAIFVEKWMWLYGQGTQFATELFTAFSSLITDAYCGSYVNNQKTIEKFCGRSMVNYTTAIMRLGADTIDTGYRYESSMDREDNDNKTTITEDTVEANRKFNRTKVTKEDYKNMDLLKAKVDFIAENSRSRDDLNTVMISIYEGAIQMSSSYTIGKDKNGMKSYPNTISRVVEMVEPYSDKNTKAYIADNLNKNIVALSKAIGEARELDEGYGSYWDVRSDCQKALTMVDEDAVNTKSTTSGNRSDGSTVNSSGSTSSTNGVGKQDPNGTDIDDPGPADSEAK